MTIIRISAAELFSKPHEFSAQEVSMLAELTDEEIEERALSDPDAQPSTPEMLRRGRENRQSRLRAAAFRDARLGAKLSRAEADSNLPLFEVTDEHGRRLLLRASACRRVESSPDPTTPVLKLEAIAAREREDEADVFAGSSESQTP